MSSIRGFVQRLIGGYSSNDQKIQHPNKSSKTNPIGDEKTGRVFQERVEVQTSPVESKHHTASIPSKPKASMNKTSNYAAKFFNKLIQKFRTHRSQGKIDQITQQMKTSHDPKSIQRSINEIRSFALSRLPSDASAAQKQNAVAQAFTKVLGQLSTSQHKEASQALSFELGKLVLKPMNKTEDIQKASKKIDEWVNKGKIKTPGNCGKDLFRFTPRINLRGKKGTKVVDRSSLSERKDQATGAQMVSILNHFYREISGENKDIITTNFSVDSLESASKLAEQLSSLMEAKNIKQQHQAQVKNFLALMGMQEIPTRIGDWTIPGGSTPDGSILEVANPYRSGHGDLRISEFSPAYTNKFASMKYERTQTFTVRPDGKFELKIYNPITFQDRSDPVEIKAVGTCGISSTLLFDNEMQLESMKQEVVPAPFCP